MTTTHRPPPAKRGWSWRSQAFRGLVYQIIALGLIALVAWFLAHNTLENMRTRGIQSGFGFLTEPAGFDIGETMFRYESIDPYWRAFAIGVANTLRVAIIGVILTTILGTLIGIGRFSRNALVRGLCYAYVETFRNIPVLLQLLMWYILFTEVLPPIADAIALAPGVFVSKSGMSFPLPVWEVGHAFAFAGLVAGLCAAWWYRRWARAQFELTGRIRSMVLAPLSIALAFSALGWLLVGAPTELDMPVKGEVIIEGGGTVTPEFISVLLGLVVYTAAFVAEVVRSGIQSVPGGQNEASRALGLARGHEMRLVVLPQALRVIIPPMTNQFLNLTKNSSLAVAIGYPDVVSISNTAINQTGRAVECIAIIMAVYLTTSLLTSLFMNWFNARAAIKER
jgi:general L-amino acid transport system permease protein